MLGPRLDLAKRPKAPDAPAKFESRIGLQVPAEVIWELVSDIDRWPRWQSVYTKASGKLRIGEKLSLTLAAPGEAPRDLTPTVLDWVPEEQILWVEKRWRGWVKIIRFIEIEAVAPGACIFANGEQYQGLLGDMYADRHRRTAKKTFAAFSEAVREKAEAIWRERSGGAT